MANFCIFCSFFNHILVVLFICTHSCGGLIYFFNLCICFTHVVWWRDVLRESVYQGHHTLLVQIGILYGMILFIVSEIMFFLAFFWAFSHQV